MNLNSEEGASLAKDIVSLVGAQTDVAVCVCPTFTTLESVSNVVSGSNVQLGAQNMHFQVSGAYTGEISAEMLRHLFTNFVILGHSERREYFGETDAIVNKKILAALDANLKPIVCIGETLLRWLKKCTQKSAASSWGLSGHKLPKKSVFSMAAL